jgi:hypothetical protein
MGLRVSLQLIQAGNVYKEIYKLFLKFDLCILMFILDCVWSKLHVTNLQVRQAYYIEPRLIKTSHPSKVVCLKELYL